MYLLPFANSVSISSGSPFPVTPIILPQKVIVIIIIKAIIIVIIIAIVIST
jgi:hypothetical protein